MENEQPSHEALLNEIQLLKKQLSELNTASDSPPDVSEISDLRMLIDNIHDPIWSVDLNYRILTLNAAFKRLFRDAFGIDIGINDSMISYIPIDSQGLWRGYFERAFRGENFSVEQQLNLQGTDRYFEFSFNPIPNRNDEVIGLSVTGRDTTERKTTELKVRESEKRFRSLVQNSNDIIFVLSGDGTIRYISPSVERILGYAPADISGTDIFTYIHPEDSDKMQKHFITDLDDRNDGTSFRCRFRRPDGDFTYIEGISSNHIEDVYIRGVVVNARDCSERIEAEEKLMDNERRFRSVVEDLPAMICRFLPDGMLTFVNGIYCHAFKKTAGELLGSNFLNLIPESERDGVREKFRSLGPGKPYMTYEHRVLLPSGETGWQRWTDRAIFNEKGEIIEYQSLGEDITEHKSLEERLRIQSEAIHATANAVMITDTDGSILWVNPAFTRHTGFRAEATIGNNPRFLKSGEHEESFYKNLWQTILSGKVWHGEIRNRTADGNIVSDRTTITPVKNHSGEITYFVAIKEFGEAS